MTLMETLTPTIRLPRLHPAQWQVARCPARFIVLITGRRFGKTLFGTASCVKRALQGQRVWWVAPSYKMAEVGWRGLKKLTRQIPGAAIRESERRVSFGGGGWVQVRSGDDPDSLRGEGLDYVVLDECAYMKSEVWMDVIRPALSDRKGGALFISTPAGRNWLWQLYQRGLDQTQTEWRSFHFITADNPYIDEAEIAAAREQLPERVFRQEYLAEFLEDTGVVFRGVEAAATAPWETTLVDHDGHRLVLGVDWGRAHDFTVLSLLCATCHQQLALDRFNRVDYAFQVQRLLTLIERWGGAGNIEICAEANAMGEPLVEQLQRIGLAVYPFVTTMQSKPPLIESLALALERGELAILADPVQIGELQAYTMILNKITGRPTYGAPEGMHDDTVVALALAWHKALASTAGVANLTYATEYRIGDSDY